MIIGAIKWFTTWSVCPLIVTFFRNHVWFCIFARSIYFVTHSCFVSLYITWKSCRFWNVMGMVGEDASVHCSLFIHDDGCLCFLLLDPTDSNSLRNPLKSFEHRSRLFFFDRALGIDKSGRTHRSVKRYFVNMYFEFLLLLFWLVDWMDDWYID